MTLNEVLGLTMMVSMLAIIFIGFPISFTLLFIALVFGSIGLGMDSTFYLSYLQIWGTMRDDILPAIPLFIFMGYMTEQAGLMGRLFQAVRNLLAPLRGSLYLAVIVTATVFAMATGIVGAAVTVLGIMAGGMMAKAGYDARMSAGAIAAGGTLGILIPPSVMLVVLAPTIGVPVNQLYASTFVPGFLIAAVYIVYTLTRSFIDPTLGPPVPIEERVASKVEVVREFLVGVVPLAALISFTLGTILAGLATATEAAACGAFGATLLALAYRRLTVAALRGATLQTITTSAMVMFLAMTSNIFGAVFAQLGAAGLVTAAIDAVPVGDLGKLLLIMLVIFLLGWPFEWPAIILVFVPIFLPIVQGLELGLTQPHLMLWFGVLVAVNLQTAFLSPPVAMSAYYLRTVMPSWSLKTIYLGMLQFMMLQLFCLSIIIAFPQIALWLPLSLR